VGRISAAARAAAAPETAGTATPVHHRPPAFGEDEQRANRHPTPFWHRLQPPVEEMSLTTIRGPPPPSEHGLQITANTTIKNIKRTGRGSPNPENYRTRIMLTRTARTAA